MTTSVSIASSSGKQTLFYGGEQESFFDTLALVNWRHGIDVLTNVRAIRDPQDREALVESFWQTDDFAFLTSMGAEIDFLASTASETLIANSKWRQTTSADTYLELFRTAGQGEALNTPFQVQLFLNHLGVDAALSPKQPTINFAIVEGAHRQVVLRNIQDFWLQISNTLEGGATFTTAFAIQNYVQKSLVVWLQIRARTVVVFSLPAPKLAPSTHEWVHSFALLTGISPPAQASEEGTIGVRYTQRPRAVEDYRDFHYRQTDRGCCARSRRPRCSGRNRKARGTTNRYFVGRDNPRRSAFRRSWANCQNARCQTA